MIQLGCRLRFSRKSPAVRFVFRKIPVQNLDRDGLVHHLVLGLIHRAHCTASDQFADAIFTAYDVSGIVLHGLPIE